MFDSTIEDFIYFHTSFTETSSNLIVELVIVKHENHKIEKVSGGFAVCSIFDFPQTATAIIVQSGSPRMYGAVSTDLN